MRQYAALDGKKYVQFPCPNFLPPQSAMHVLLTTNRLSFPPDKKQWFNKDRLRWASQLNVPMSQATPPEFPFNSMHIQRALTSLALARPELLESAVALFWEHTWVLWREPDKAENILALMKTVVGGEEEARRIVEAMQSEEVKRALVANTEQAFKDGAFGLPWFVGECSFFLIRWGFVFLSFWLAVGR